MDRIERNAAALSYRQLVAVAKGAAELAIGPAAMTQLQNGRAIVEKIIASGERAYGISTGLGALSEIVLTGAQQTELSRNTLMSHACGIGAPLSDVATRAIMNSLVNDLCHGKSGVSPAVVTQLVSLLNRKITPVVPSQGSVGYIVHGAHIGLALIGMGDVMVSGRRMSASQALAAAGLAPVTLGAKDGLCLVNGTRCLTGLACLALAEAEPLADWADVTGALSFEALKGQIAAYDETMLAMKPHPGLIHVGKRLRALLAGSEIVAKHQGFRTQDALSIRSIPQIHGATRDQIDHVKSRSK